jgi:hypothetical protein
MERRSESRLSVELPGSYQVAGDEAHSMFFSQISSRGCRLAADELALEVGAGIELYLGAIGPIGGVVRWVRSGAAGVEFDAALDAMIVGHFAAFINDVA